MSVKDRTPIDGLKLDDPPEGARTRLPSKSADFRVKTAEMLSGSPDDPHQTTRPLLGVMSGSQAHLRAESEVRIHFPPARSLRTICSVRGFQP